jgi:hypothetical protein
VWGRRFWNRRTAWFDWGRGGGRAKRGPNSSWRHIKEEKCIARAKENNLA